MAELLLGKEVVSSLTEKLRIETEELKKLKIEPTLAIVRVGENDSDMAYERGATKRAEAIGIKIKKIVLPFDETQKNLLKEIDTLNRDESIHGVLLFRPLPKHIDDEAVRNAITPKKDVDGITDASMIGVYAGTNQGFAPCTAEAVMEMLNHYDIDIIGKKAVVIGRSLVIGKPVAMMLLKENATVTVCHTKTKHIADICQDGDILVAAAGKAKSIGKTYVKAGQTVIDVGINMDENGKMCGDLDFESVKDIVGAITPVPGGIGAVTSTILMKHVVKAAKAR